MFPLPHQAEAVNIKLLEDKVAAVDMIEALNKETPTHLTKYPSPDKMLSGKSKNLTGHT